MSFSYYRTLTIDYTKCGSSNSSNFPVLVSITDSTLATTAHGGNVQNSSGYDLCFYADSGAVTILPWEVESYNATTGALLAWVQLPTVSHSTNTVFYLFYGNAAITTFQGGSTGAAWDGNYQGVYHLGNGSTLSVADSTGNSNTLTNSGATATTGPILGAAAVTGSSGLNGPKLAAFTGTTPITMEAWVYPTGAGNYATIVGQFNGGTRAFAMWLDPNDTNIDMDLNGFASITVSPLWQLLAWNHIVGTANGTNWTIYVNASPASHSETGLPVNVSGSTLAIGHDYQTNNFNGSIAEVRVSNIVRSADWILTEYNNQHAPSSFITLGSQQSSGNVGLDQVVWRGLNRGIEYQFDEGGRVKANVSPWVTQAPVIDNLAWQKVKRNVEYIFDEAGRTARWIPAASNLNYDQIPWRGLNRTILYSFDEGGLLKTSGWIYPFQPPPAEELMWRRIKRDIEYTFDEAGRVKQNVAPWVTQAPVIDNLAWQRLKRNVEYAFDEAGLAKTTGSLFAATVVQSDQLAWRALRRSIEYTFEEGSKLGRWIPDASHLASDQLPWRAIQRAIAYSFDEGGLAKTAGWMFAPVVTDHLGWRSLYRNIDYQFDEAGRARSLGYLFTVQAPVIDNLAWQKLARFVQYAFDEAGRLPNSGFIFTVQVPPPLPIVRPVGFAVSASPTGSAVPAMPGGLATSGGPEGIVS